ncbi:MAG TPA: GFA family protein [Candidatus Binatia bacterium]|nr:GFA family protein [Candidatus Binatia bacterium]
MLRGSCLCRTVRYEVSGPVHDVHHCHCSICRKSHGAAFSTFARLTAADFRLVAGRENVRAYRSSPPIERTFCATCGARLTIRFDGMPDAVWVSLTTLDDDPGVRPDAHMFVASKAPWDEITDDLRQYPAYGPMGG